MKIIKIVTITAFLALGVMAQSKTNDNRNVKTKPLVVKISSVESTAYKTYIATAYSLKGKTTSGENVRNGIIAADRRVLPLGTVVHIEGMGIFIVKDVGPAIKGNRIDIWISSKPSALRFGRRNVKLRIISKPVKT